MTARQNETAMVRCASCAAINRVPWKRLKENPLCGACRKLLDFPMSAVRVTARSFDEELAAWPETVLAYFWNKDCEPCRSAEPVVDDIAFLRAGRIKVLKIDTAADPSLADRYAIRAAPVFLVLRNRSLVARLDGVPREKIELLQWIELQMGQPQ